MMSTSSSVAGDVTTTTQDTNIELTEAMEHMIVSSTENKQDDHTNEVCRLRVLLDQITKEKEQLESLLKAEQAQRKAIELENEALKRTNGELKRENERLTKENQKWLKPNGSTAPFERSDINTRVLTMHKGDDGKIGIDHYGTVVAKVYVGWPAERAGLMPGDQMVSINGIVVKFLSNNEIRNVLARVPGEVKLVLRYNPERLNDFLNAVNESQK